VSLEVGAGEIVGLFGLVGSGRSELLETIFGLHKAQRGTIEVAGTRLGAHSPRQAARRGIALVPEERHRQGLFFNLTLRHNLMMPARTVAGDILIRDAEEWKQCEQLMSEWRVKAPGPGALPDSLSGGNQQKVVLGKWLAGHANVFIFDEPTRGVDVGAKAEIYHLMNRLTAQGAAILMISSELPELLGMSDRVLVMCRGRIQAEFAAGTASEEMVLSAALGLA
jgi:ABC-type sugar transport system ATPase subunit